MNLKIKVKKLHPEAKLPQKSHKTDAGADLTAIDVSYTDDYVEFGTGLAIEIPENHVGLIFPRSSISKKDLSLCNAVGVVDHGYLGEIKFRFKFTGNKSMFSHDIKNYKPGDRVGQLIVLPYPEVSFEETTELSNSERGTGGFGSTNK